MSSDIARALKTVVDAMIDGSIDAELRAGCATDHLVFEHNGHEYKVPVDLSLLLGTLTLEDALVIPAVRDVEPYIQWEDDHDYRRID